LLPVSTPAGQHASLLTVVLLPADFKIFIYGLNNREKKKKKRKEKKKKKKNFWVFQLENSSTCDWVLRAPALGRSSNQNLPVSSNPATGVNKNDVPDTNRMVHMRHIASGNRM
jgi:hypothetical protein